MNEPSNVVRGILHSDGTLELLERPALPAGEVEVTIRPVETGYPTLPAAPDEVAESKKKEENWFEYLQRTRAELEASGAVFRTEEEINGDIEEMRDWDSRLDEIRLQIEERRGKEQK